MLPESNPHATLELSDPELSESDFALDAAEATPTAPRIFRIHPIDSGAGLVKIESDSFVFGRGESCDVIIDEKSASRRHAAIIEKAEGWYVSDLNSTNGTWVNDERVKERQLKSGDCIRVGRWTFKYFVGDNIESNYHETVYQMMTKDTQTGAWNKRYLNDILTRELCHHKRSGHPLCLLMVDIDHFKKINDQYGHHVGDEVLAEFGRRVMATIRTGDVFARYGGDEFTVLMVNSTRVSASIAAKRILRTVLNRPFRTSAGDLNCSISCGFAECTIEKSLDRDEFLRLADQRLYEAKDSGRSKVIG